MSTQVRLRVDAVGADVVELAGEVDLHAVREVAAVGQLEAEDLVARVDQRVQHGRVGLRAGVRLDVRVLGAEQLLGALDREVLGDVDLLAAAVVAAARVALGVLVGQHRALRLQDGARHEVLARDHLERVALARELAVEDGGDLGVELGERLVQQGVGGRSRAHGSPRSQRCAVVPGDGHAHLGVVTGGPGVRPEVCCCVAPRW